MKCEICGELHSLDEGKIIEENNHIYLSLGQLNPGH